MPNHAYRNFRIVGCLLLIAVLTGWFSGVSWGVAVKPTGKEILRRAASRYDFIRDYTVDVKLDIQSPSTHISNVEIRVYYKRPNLVHLEATRGFAVLPRRGGIFGNPVREFASILRPSIRRSESVAGRECWVVDGTMRNPDARGRLVTWIDKADFSIRRVKIARDIGISEEIEFKYSIDDPRQVFPVSTFGRVFSEPVGEPGMRTAGRIGPTTIVRMDFSGYKINTGLSEKLFRTDPHR